MIINSNTPVVLENRGQLILRPNDHKATGGEGSIYRVADTIIKLYLDPKKMILNNMIDKIKLLIELQHNYIVSPKGLVKDTIGNPIGFYMDYANGEPLARFFTNDFRNKNKFTDKNSSVLIDKMREVFLFAHQKQAILGDPNELNWNVVFNQNDLYPLVMDVDSWGIGKWQSDVIMPSIRDWHTKGLNEITDWFAWGIVTFQIYTGIHPYKGTLNGYKIGDFTNRMKDNASVFNSNVSLNSAVRDFNCIPGRLLEWYKATFQDGERTMPPSPFDTAIMTPKIAITKRVVTTNTAGLLSFDKLYSDSVEKIIKVFPCGIGLSNNGKLIDLGNKKIIGLTNSNKCEIIKVENGWLIANFDGKLEFNYIHSFDFKSERVDFNLKVYDLIRYENRLFVVTDQGLTEIKFQIFNKPIVSVGQTWSAMINSTQWFDGLGIQDSMGAIFIITPFNDKSCVYTRVKELDRLKPIIAKAGNRFVSIVAINKQGVYQKLELMFNNDYSSYTCWNGIADSSDLNLSILPKGVCATIVNDGELVIFVPSNSKVNKIQDKAIDTTMKLENWDNKVVYIKDGELWSLSMK
jgi:hypothetical protein